MKLPPDVCLELGKLPFAEDTIALCGCCKRSDPSVVNLGRYGMDCVTGAAPLDRRDCSSPKSSSSSQFSDCCLGFLKYASSPVSNDALRARGGASDMDELWLCIAASGCPCGLPAELALEEERGRLFIIGCVKWAVAFSFDEALGEYERGGLATGSGGGCLSGFIRGQLGLEMSVLRGVAIFLGRSTIQSGRRISETRYCSFNFDSCYFVFHHKFRGLS